MTPFITVFGYEPNIPGDVEDESRLKKKLSAIKKRIEKIELTRQRLKENLARAQKYQKKYYDSAHMAAPKYEVKNLVMVSAKHIHIIRPSKKLDYRYLGPFKVLKKIGRRAYRVKFILTYSRFHPVFYVSLLEPYRCKAGEKIVKPSTIKIAGMCYSIGRMVGR